MLNSSKLDCNVCDNLKKVKLWFLIPAVIILLVISVYFIFINNDSFTNAYVSVQKDLFYYLNSKLSKLPALQNNLTQLGDVLIFFPLITIFFIYSPKLWEALITSALLSLIVSAVLKKLFAMPRPAAVFDTTSFTIIGKTLNGKTSLPSGHSIATFVVITILLFAFMPKKNIYKIIWSFFILSVGFIIGLSRVGVGAHYPLDVLIGCTLGYSVVVLGIILNGKLNWLSWISYKKAAPFFILLFLIWGAVIIKKIIDTNLPICYLSVAALVITISIMSSIYYVQRKN